MTASKDDFNPLTFEKKLTHLKDTQDSIQGLSAWCLQQRQHHKKIVASWLNVLKRAKVDQRLVLFYLANDVIQNSKRKNYEFVESWGTTLQKATPLVRDDKVKHRILRIFKIWEERNVYDEEFLTDLTGLLSAAAGKQSDNDSSEFQAMQLVNKIKQCSVLEADTDMQLKKIHDSPLSLTDIDLLCATLKERRDAEDAVQEVEEGVLRLEGYVRAIQKELVARAALCHILHMAAQHYGVQRGEVKVVANAYRNFGSRVRNLKRKLEETIPTLPSAKKSKALKRNNIVGKTSPVPSPPSPGEAVPSPEPDEDIDLPQDSGEEMYNLDKTFSTSILGDELGKGFSSFMGNPDFSFSFNKETSESNSTGSKIEVISSLQSSASNEDFNINDFLKSLIQPKAPINSHSDGAYPLNSVLTPPPPPPTLPGLDLLIPQTSSKPISGVPPPGGMLAPPPPPPLVTNFYGSNNHEQLVSPTETYSDHQSQWNSNAWENPVETPESPPHAETVSNINVPPPIYTEPPPPPPRADVDHRSLSHIAQLPPIAQHKSILEGDDVDHRVLPPPITHPQAVGNERNRSHMADVDHRNLISLTGTLPPPPIPPMMGSWSPHAQPIDQDYRSIGGSEISTLHAPPPIPSQLQRKSLRDSPPPSNVVKSIPNTPPIIVSSLPPNMPSHPPDMTKMPPNIPDVTKLPPNLGSHPPLIATHPNMVPDMRQLPPSLHGPPSFPSELSQIPPPPNMAVHPPNMQMHIPLNLPLRPPNIHMNMPALNQFTSHSSDQNSLANNSSISHLPPSSMLKHPPDVLNQNHNMPPPHRGVNPLLPPPNMPMHQHIPMINQILVGGNVTGRHNRTDNVESIDMEMSDEEMMDDEYSHLGLESAMSRIHSNTRSFSYNNRVLVGGDMPYSYNNKAGHVATPKTDHRSNLVRINSTDGDTKKDEVNNKIDTDDKNIKSILGEKILSNDFLLTDNLISDDEDFFNEINDLDENASKSPDIFDEVLLSSVNPENPNLKKKVIKPKDIPEKAPELEPECVKPEAKKVEEVNEEPPKWTERAAAINPMRPVFQGRPMLRGNNRFRPPLSIFQRIRAPHANEFYNQDFRPPMRRPWGRPPRGFW